MPSLSFCLAETLRVHGIRLSRAEPFASPSPFLSPEESFSPSYFAISNAIFSSDPFLIVRNSTRIKRSDNILAQFPFHIVYHLCKNLVLLVARSLVLTWFPFLLPQKARCPPLKFDSYKKETTSRRSTCGSKREVGQICEFPNWWKNGGTSGRIKFVPF